MFQPLRKSKVFTLFIFESNITVGAGFRVRVAVTADNKYQTIFVPAGNFIKVTKDSNTIRQ
jgi:hypothetical protein